MNLRISLIQTSLVWHDARANRARFERLLAPLSGTTDLIVLPEMFTTGFTMDAAEVAEPAAGPTLDWLRATAAKASATITGSVVTHEAGRYFNRLLWVQPDGHCASY